MAAMEITGPEHTGIAHDVYRVVFTVGGNARERTTEVVLHRGYVGAVDLPAILARRLGLATSAIRVMDAELVRHSEGV